MEILVLLVTSLKLYLIKVKITEENISPYSSQKKKKNVEENGELLQMF